MSRFRSRLWVLALLAAGACGDADAPGPVAPAGAGLAYEARFTARRTDVFKVEVRITNRSGAPRTLRFPDTCVVLLRAYFPNAGRLAWDQREREKGCVPLPVTVPLAPGESRAFDEQIGSLGILGFSLPEGDYQITAYLRPVDEPEVELDLGVIPLERPTDL